MNDDLPIRKMLGENDIEPATKIMAEMIAKRIYSADAAHRDRLGQNPIRYRMDDEGSLAVTAQVKWSTGGSEFPRGTKFETGHTVSSCLVSLNGVGLDLDAEERKIISDAIVNHLNRSTIELVAQIKVERQELATAILEAWSSK